MVTTASRMSPVSSMPGCAVSGSIAVVPGAVVRGLRFAMPPRFWWQETFPVVDEDALDEPQPAAPMVCWVMAVPCVPRKALRPGDTRCVTCGTWTADYTFCDCGVPMPVCDNCMGGRHECDGGA